MSKIPHELALKLKSIGVKYVFGIPGGPSIQYIEEFNKQNIQFITTANEQSAGIIADVMGRLTGTPGICHATFGAGATNLATGVGEALLDRSPLIAFTTEVKDEDRNRVMQMNINHQDLFRPITKKTSRLSDKNFTTLIDDSLTIALTEQPGPVHIGLPIDLIEKNVEPIKNSYKIKDKKMPINKANLEEVKKLIKESKKPILAVGLTSARLNIKKQLELLIKKLNVPVFITPMAKGVISETNPWYGGVFFHARSDISANIYRQADLIIGIGYDPIEFNYETWMPHVPLIHMDTSDLDISTDYKHVYKILGDLKDAVEIIMQESYPKFNWEKSNIIRNKEMLFKSLIIETDTFNPVDLIIALQAAIPDESIVTCDVGAHLHLMGQLWKCDNNRFLISNGWSGMGFSIPAAIGAKLAQPKNTVVSISGDGGFLMNCGEIAVAKRLNLDIVFIVLVDGNYSLIKVKENWEKVKKHSTELSPNDYFKSDYFLGVPIYKAKNNQDIKNIFGKIFDYKGPSIIEAEVDGSIYKDLIINDYK